MALMDNDLNLLCGYQTFHQIVSNQRTEIQNGIASINTNILTPVAAFVLANELSVLDLKKYPASGQGKICTKYLKLSVFSSLSGPCWNAVVWDVVKLSVFKLLLFRSCFQTIWLCVSCLVANSQFTCQPCHYL